MSVRIAVVIVIVFVVETIGVLSGLGFFACEPLEIVFVVVVFVVVFFFFLTSRRRRSGRRGSTVGPVCVGIISVGIGGISSGIIV